MSISLNTERSSPPSQQMMIVDEAAVVKVDRIGQEMIEEAFKGGKLTGGLGGKVGVANVEDSSSSLFCKCCNWRSQKRQTDYAPIP